MSFVVAIKCFFKILFDPAFAQKAGALLEGSAPAAGKAAPAGPSAAALLAVLQRDGRLLDFLMEKIDGIPDAQVGAVARTVHQGCRKALQEYIKVEPVLAQSEGTAVTVEPGFDASSIRVVGNVTGDPPFKGALRHHGWRLSEITLPARAAGTDGSVIMPAEVEI
ncbi:MAG: DUF2760 domain-containing protein [Candidatus Xenobia bacterium]